MKTKKKGYCTTSEEVKKLSLDRSVNSKRDISKKARIESVAVNRSRTQGITTLPSLSPLLSSRKFHRVGCDQNPSALPSKRDTRWKNQPAFPHNSPHLLSLGVFFCASDSPRDRLCVGGKHAWSISFLQINEPLVRALGLDDHSAVPIGVDEEPRCTGDR